MINIVDYGMGNLRSVADLALRPEQAKPEIAEVYGTRDTHHAEQQRGRGGHDRSGEFSIRRPGRGLTRNRGASEVVMKWPLGGSNRCSCCYPRGRGYNQGAAVRMSGSLQAAHPNLGMASSDD